jgi:acetyl esterase/lipase
MFRIAIAFLAMCIAQATAAPRQPVQPKSGPGGASYVHAAMRESEHGAGGKRFWIFEPEQPTPKTAPVVLFLHGYSAMTPEPYRAWIAHIVRRGSVVIYPQFQKDLITPPPEFLPNTVAAVRAALGVLAEDGHVAPDVSRFVVVGHSAGGVGAAGFAAVAEKEKLPVPLAIMPVHAGQGPENGWQMIPMETLDTIPKQTRVAIVVGDADKFVGTRSSRKIWEGAKHVSERRFITLQSDAHGWPPLSPGHLAPLAQNRLSTNAHDWRGYWRLFDELCEAVFSGRPFEPSPDMGKWSDGQPVEPLLIER